jgi:hypothetical protein
VAGDNKVKVFITGVDEFSATFSKFQHGLGNLKDDLLHLVEAAGVASFGEFIHSTSEAIENMGRLSEKTGVAVEDLSALSFAAKMSDVPFEGLAKGIEKLSKAMLGLEDSPKGNAASQAIRNLGVETKNADGTLRSASAVFIDISEKFSRMKDGAEKTGLALQIFGKAGAELIPLMNQGAAGIEALMAKAKELGVVLTKEDVEAAQHFNDTIKIALEFIKGLGFQFVEGLLPALTAVARSLGDATSGFMSAKGAGEKLGEFVKLVALTFLDLGYSLDLAIIKLQRFAPLMEALSNLRNPGALAGALSEFNAAGKDTDAQIQALNTHFLQMWETLSNPSKGSKSEGPEKVFTTLKGKIKETEEELSAFEKMWNDLAAIGDATNDVLRKVEAHRADAAALDKDLAALQARLAALDEFLKSHPGEFFPEVAKQASDVKKAIEELEKEKEKLETPPKIEQMPGGPMAVRRISRSTCRTVRSRSRPRT